MVDMIDGKLLKPLELRAGDGRLLTSEEIEIRPGRKSRVHFSRKGKQGEFG
jgi:hypothetical protein